MTEDFKKEMMHLLELDYLDSQTRLHQNLKKHIQKQRNDLLNEVKDKLSNMYYLEQRDQELINDCVDALLVAINYTPTL
tara:strand:+ start:306 stop:542 length:237 start_codon:yes stop_codon:yes gene_type:complete